MPFTKRRKPLFFSEEEMDRLRNLQRSRRGEQRKVMRASILLDSVAGLNDQAVATKNAHRWNIYIRQNVLPSAVWDARRPISRRRIFDV